MKLKKDRTRVLILSHFLINPILNDSAVSTAMRNFLKDRVKKITQIEYPFPDSKDKYLYALRFEDGLQKEEYKTSALKKPGWFSYLLSPFAILYLVFKTGLKYDLAIACESLSFISIWPLRRIGLVRKLIYYSVDYIDERFDNCLLNKIYHIIDRFACTRSDRNWVVAKAQVKGREVDGMNIGKCSPFRIVPIGFRRSEIKLLPVKKIDFYRLVFCGALKESAGPQLIIEALPSIVKEIPKIHVVFAGSGEYKRYLIKLAKDLAVEDYVEFLTDIKSHRKLTEVLARGGIGLAPYALVEKSLSYYSDPGKIKLYLACGLPVITTHVATSGSVLARKGAGIVINYDKRGLQGAISKMLGSREKFIRFRNSAIELSRVYDVDSILEVAFKNV